MRISGAQRERATALGGGAKKTRNFITVSTKLFYDAQMKGAPSDGTRHEQKN